MSGVPCGVTSASRRLGISSICQSARKQRVLHMQSVGDVFSRALLALASADRPARRRGAPMVGAVRYRCRPVLWVDLGARRGHAVAGQVDVVAGQVAGTNASSQTDRHGRRRATPAERIDDQVAAVGVQPQAARADRTCNPWCCRSSVIHQTAQSLRYASDTCTFAVQCGDRCRLASAFPKTRERSRCNKHSYNHSKNDG